MNALKYTPHLPVCPVSVFPLCARWLNDFINSETSGVTRLWHCHHVFVLTPQRLTLYICHTGVKGAHAVLFLLGPSYLPGLRDGGERHHETTTEGPKNRQAGERAPHQHGVRTDRSALLRLLHRRALP